MMDAMSGANAASHASIQDRLARREPKPPARRASSARFLRVTTSPVRLSFLISRSSFSFVTPGQRASFAVRLVFPPPTLTASTPTRGDRCFFLPVHAPPHRLFQTARCSALTLRFVSTAVLARPRAVGQVPLADGRGRGVGAARAQGRAGLLALQVGCLCPGHQAQHPRPAPALLAALPRHW
eukprot:3631164-Rhodomonas_salina.1